MSAPTQKRRQKQSKRRVKKQEQARATAPIIDAPWGVILTSGRASRLRGGSRELYCQGLTGLVRASK